MTGFIESVRASAEATSGKPMPTGQAKAAVALLGVVVAGWFWWMNQPDATGPTIRVTAAEWGARWPYPGFSEGLLFCRMHKGSPATFIRLGGKDFGTNGVAYDMPGVTPDRGLMKRAAFPYYGIDSDAGDGAQAQLDRAKALCK